MGPVGEYLPGSGQDGPWKYTTTADSFEIENIGDPNAIKYFYHGHRRSDEGQRRVEVSIGVQDGRSGSAGIIYGLNPDAPSYHLITLSGDGVFRIFRRDSGGFRAMVEATSDAFLPGKINRLKVEEAGDNLTYFLNDRELGSIGGDRFGFGFMGLAAVGDVRAFFNGYSVVSGQRSETPAPQPNRQAGATTPRPNLTLRPVEIMEDAGPLGRVTAARTLNPSDWTTTGGIKWSQGAGPAGCFTGAQMNWGAGNEDQSYGMAVMDPMSWGVSTSGPAAGSCMQQDLPDAEAAARAYLKIFEPKIRFGVKKVERPPELEPFKQMIERASPPNTLPGVRQWVDAVLVTGSSQSDEGDGAAAFIFVTGHTEGSVGPFGYRTGRTAMVLGFFTPVGKIEEGHPGFGAVMNNMRFNPDWQRGVSQWWQQVYAERRRSRVQNQAVNTAGEKTAGDILFEGWQSRQGMIDSGHAKSINSINEVEPYRDTSGNTVLLSQDYRNKWQLDDGSIIMTDDDLFDPMQSFNQFGTALQPAN